MKHTYEIRKLEKNEKVTTIEKFEAEPKEAKRKVREFAGKHPGLYTLYKIEAIDFCFTEKGEN